MRTAAQLIVDTVEVLSGCGVFTRVLLKDGSTEVMTGKEPLAAVAYAGFETLSDGGVQVTEHRLKIYVRLLSVGSADTSPLHTAVEAIKNTPAVSVSSSIHTTDTRTMTFVIEAGYRC
ncbi:hypothetical protein [Seleniivibrio woodruffii]|uniref:hypothetical protein n=1 Tax=Seleniivibrio woodruffii TaxID=1078050 RepID=UPI0039E353CB